MVIGAEFMVFGLGLKGLRFWWIWGLDGWFMFRMQFGERYGGL